MRAKEVQDDVEEIDEEDCRERKLTTVDPKKGTPGDLA